MSDYTVALCGNPNCGKTTLFNLLTKQTAKTGNYTGVTVDLKRGKVASNPRIEVVDLPGLYSLNSFTEEEQISARFVMLQQTDLIVNVIDATALRRGLFLTTQLLALNRKVVAVLNMYDEAITKGIDIDLNKLQNTFGIPFLTVSAKTGQGIEQLIRQLPTYIEESSLPADKNLKLSSMQKTAFAQKAYRKIDACLSLAVKKTKSNLSLTDKIDRIVTHRYLAFPILALVLCCTFLFAGAGGGISKALEHYFGNSIKTGVSALLNGQSAPNWFVSFCVDGVLSGVLGVVSYIPQIAFLFLAIAFLEGSGYMARISFITDRVMRDIGLSGKSFVSLCVACGCAVPAILSSRVLKSRRERHRIITLCPCMPCSAKLTLISLFCEVLFDNGFLFATAFYFLSLLAVCLGGLALQLFKDDDKNCDVFLSELPAYRLPALKETLLDTSKKLRDFVLKIGSVVLLCSVVLWFLSSYNPHFEFCEINDSLLCSFGKALSFLFAPLGFGDWRFTVAVFAGIAAKENTVSALNILCDTATLKILLTFPAAVCFVAYNILTIPCVSAVAATVRELGTKKALFSVAFQLCFAYAFCVPLYSVCSLFVTFTHLPLLLGVVTACIAVALICKRKITLSTAVTGKKRKKTDS